jgi:hypothetical protein
MSRNPSCSFAHGDDPAGTTRRYRVRLHGRGANRSAVSRRLAIFGLRRATSHFARL